MADDMKGRLEKRNEDRLSEVDRRRQEKAEQSQPEEDPQALISIFLSEKEIIERMLADVGNIEKCGLIVHFDEVSRKIQVLHKFLSDSLAFLPSYAVKQRQKDITKLEQDMNEKRNCYLPKKKFAFSKKKQSKIEKSVDQKDNTATTGIVTESEDLLRKETVSESELILLSGQDITKQQTDLQDKDLTFSKLQDSTIRLHGSPSALHLVNLERCKVFCGPVSGSIFIDNCKDCTFVFACQQLRVHTTIDSNFYLLVTSRAIIEDCGNIGFTEFNWSYPGIDDHFETSRLDRTKNNWNLVNDFNWLRTDKPSPNWHVIAEDMVQSWD